MVPLSGTNSLSDERSKSFNCDVYQPKRIQFCSTLKVVYFAYHSFISLTHLANTGLYCYVLDSVSI